MYSVVRTPQKKDIPPPVSFEIEIRNQEKRTTRKTSNSAKSSKQLTVESNPTKLSEPESKSKTNTNVDMNKTFDKGLVDKEDILENVCVVPENICNGCEEEVTVGQKGVVCESCQSWCHASCENISQFEYETLGKLENSLTWNCSKCRTLNREIMRKIDMVITDHEAVMKENKKMREKLSKIEENMEKERISIKEEMKKEIMGSLGEFKKEIESLRHGLTEEIKASCNEIRENVRSEIKDNWLVAIETNLGNRIAKEIKSNIEGVKESITAEIGRNLMEDFEGKVIGKLRNEVIKMNSELAEQIIMNVGRRENSEDQEEQNGEEKHRKLQENIVNIMRNEEDRKRRANNIVVFGLDEPTVVGKAEKEEEELKGLNEVLSEGLRVNVGVAQITRLGEPRQDGKERPLLVRLNSPKEKWEIVKRAKQLNGGRFRKVIVVPDKNREEREHDKYLAEQLRVKRSRGETGWKIRRGELIKLDF